MKNVDLSKFNVRTDLAVEALDGTNDESVKKFVYNYNNIKVSKVIVNENEKEAIRNKPGIYYNIDTKALIHQDFNEVKETEEVFCKYLNEMLKILSIKDSDSCLVVGLGNKHVTPDSLGPKVVDELLITKHIFTLDKQNIEPGFRDVSAIIPGVMGETGIETFDIVKSVVDSTKPNFVIVVDALASKSIERVNRTIQMTDAGISPGSGVANNRKELSYETLNIPVIAIGVPTVVDAVSITNDSIGYILKYLNKRISNKNNPLSLDKLLKYDYDEIDLPNNDLSNKLLGMIGELSESDKRELISDVLTPSGYNMMVTPKEIDDSIVNLTKIISRSIDKCLHKKIQ